MHVCRQDDIETKAVADLTQPLTRTALSTGGACLLQLHPSYPRICFQRSQTAAPAPCTSPAL